jgi:predicted amidohydrolase
MSGLPTVPLRLAVVQARAAPGQVATNTRRAAFGALRAARRGARLVVLPELHLGGYDLTQVRDSAVTADGAGAVSDARLAPLTDVAGNEDLTVLVGAAVRRTDGTLTNSLLVVDADGVRVGYDKQHLWHDEAAVFTPGATGSAVLVDGWRIGLGICYDMSFPEHARAAALAGAQVYVCAGAFASGNEHRAAVYLAARALENTVFTAFVNPVGGPASRPCRGGTALWAPDGRRLGSVPGDRGGQLRCDLDPDDLARVRAFLPMLQECRSR